MTLQPSVRRPARQTRSKTPSVSGALEDGSAEVEIGAGFVGNIDGFRLTGLRNASDVVTLRGADGDGVVTLDESGNATITIEAHDGRSSTGVRRYTIVGGPVPTPTPGS